MAFMRNQGLTSMLKEGAKLIDDPVVKNIHACKELAAITRTSLGPQGLCKLVINYLNKTFVTHDANTIMTELEVQHPAAKLLVMAAKSMSEEVGDGTNLVVILAGELLNQAENLLRKGLHVSDIIAGYQKAGHLALELLPSLSVGKIEDVKNAEQVTQAVATAIGSKQPQHKDLLASLVVQACINVCPKNPMNFSVDNVRVCKMEGLSVGHSQVVHGFMITRDTEGTIKHVENAKIAVYNCAIDLPNSDTKGTVLIESAEELKNVSLSEETQMEKIIKAIADCGVKVVVGNANFGDLALHYLERYDIMAVKVASKFELRRLSAAVNAQQLTSLLPPSVEDMGFVDQVSVEEIALKKVVVFRQNTEKCKLSTILVRGPTSNIMDDVERAVDDGVNTFKALARDPRLVAGGGAVELELSKKLSKTADATPGLDQYAIQKFAQTLEVIPRTLVEVSGHYDGAKVVATLLAQHQNGQDRVGVNTEDGTGMDMVDAGVVDLLLVKEWAIKFATEAAVNVLRVDQIIMSKPAGGPKNAPAGGGARDDED